MKSLSIEEYINILHKNKQHTNFSEWAYWMKKWDEVRTDVNPNAKWYEEEKEDSAHCVRQI